MASAQGHKRGRDTKEGAHDNDDCFLCIEKRAGKAARAKSLQQLLTSKTFLSAENVASVDAQVITFTAIFDCFMNRKRGVDFCEGLDDIDLAEMFIRCNIVDALVAVLSLDTALLEAAIDGPIVKYCCLSIVAMLSGWTQQIYDEAGEEKIRFLKRYKKIMEAMCRRDLFIAVINCMNIGPLETLRVPFALRYMAKFYPPACRLLMDLNAVPVIAQICLPLYLEGVIIQAKNLPYYAIVLCAAPHPGLYAGAVPSALTQRQARERLWARTSPCRESAGDILQACAASLPVDLVSKLLVCPLFKGVLHLWLYTPVINVHVESSLTLSYTLMLSNLCAQPALVDTLLRDFDLLNVILRGLYSPSAVALHDYLVCIRHMAHKGGPILKAFLAEPLIIRQLVVLCYTPVERIAVLAYDCLELFFEHPRWPFCMGELVRDEFIYDSLCWALIVHRTKPAQRIGRGLWKQLLLVSPGKTQPNRPRLSSMVARESGNAKYKERQYQAARVDYTEAINQALANDEPEEMHSLYGNRAQCNSLLGRQDLALRDASLALAWACFDVMDVSGEKTCSLRAKNLARQAQALDALEQPIAAANSIAHALMLSPANEDFAAQRRELLRIVERATGRLLTCAACGAGTRLLQICTVCTRVGYCSTACERSGRMEHARRSEKCVPKDRLPSFGVVFDDDVDEDDGWSDCDGDDDDDDDDDDEDDEDDDEGDEDDDYGEDTNGDDGDH